MLTLRIRRLNQRDVCSDFCSGEKALDEFFRRYAQKNLAMGLSSTHVACADDKIVGFVTIG